MISAIKTVNPKDAKVNNHHIEFYYHSVLKTIYIYIYIIIVPCIASCIQTTNSIIMSAIIKTIAIP